MADVQPLRALHYDLDRVGGLQPVAAPPYDVIDAAQRAELLGAVAVQRRRDRPAAERRRSVRARRRGAAAAGATRASSCATTQPALWALAQDYTGPDGQRAHAPRRSSRACASRTTARGGSARTSARTRARRRTGCGSRARRSANLSPIFSLYDDPAGAAWGALAPHVDGAPWGEVTDDDGTVHRLWRVADPAAIDAVQRRARRAPSC